MRIFGLAQILVGTLILVFPQQWTFVLNLGARALPGFFVAMPPLPDDPLWAVFASSSYAMQAALFLLAAERAEVSGFVLTAALGKAIPLTFMVSQLIQANRNQWIFGYALCAAIDVTLLLGTMVLFLGARLGIRRQVT